MDEQSIEDPINWIEEALSKEHIKYYEYENFSNIKVIGSGAFGKVCRAKWKNLQYFALKSFHKFDKATVNEIICEVIIIII